MKSFENNLHGKPSPSLWKNNINLPSAHRLVMVDLSLYRLATLHFVVKQGQTAIKALTTLVGQLSLSVGWESSPERGRKTVSFNP